jgi:hypothetical protein
MITDIDQKSNITSLNIETLPSYWSDYFDYEKDSELYDLTKKEINETLELKRKEPKVFIDSQVVISDILTKLGSKHNFHRQFKERHKNSDSGQVLGMQLYHIMVNDRDVWIYSPTQHRGHKYSHATYWM